MLVDVAGGDVVIVDVVGGDVVPVVIGGVCSCVLATVWGWLDGMFIELPALN